MKGNPAAAYSVNGAALGRIAAAFAAILMLLLLIPAPNARAQDEAPLTEVVVFVLDLSGSMNEPFDGGQSKLDVAKAAFVEAFANVNPNARVGLRVYGDQRPATAAADREQNCTSDSRLVVPVSELQREQLISEVQGFSALGDTAIGLALRQADSDIPDGSIGTIVLFSDGRDECFDADLDGDPATGPSFGENPCDVAAEIGGRGDDLRIDRIITVGFAADAAAEEELRCIASSTGGKYTAIATPEDARDVLPELLAELGSAREAERLVGQEIAGTPTREGAPELIRLDAEDAPSGLYTDSIKMNSQKLYRLDEFGPEKGTFTATVFGLPPDQGIVFDMRLFIPSDSQSFFTDQGNSNAGIPERATASIRCAGCQVSDGPHEVFWIVSLNGPNSDPSVRYELEIVTEGPGFGGDPTSCSEPQECWYPRAIDQRTAELAKLETDLAEASENLAPQELLDRRSQLQDQLDSAEAANASIELRAGAMEARIVDAPLAGRSFAMPLMFVVIGLVLGFLPVGALRKLMPTGKDDAGESGDAAEQEVDAPASHPEHAPPPSSPADEAKAAERAAKIAKHRAAQEVAQEAARAEAQAPQDAPPGWYQDPMTPELYRWWNGRTWTQDTSPDATGGL